MKKVIIINGPNLNLLGKREEKIYGNKNFGLIMDELNTLAKGRIELDYFQSNHEGEIIDQVHKNIGKADYIVINPGAFTHYSYGIYDAIISSRIPTIEVHISNIFGREDWRSKSVISPGVKGIISGFGTDVYRMAIQHILNTI